MTDEQRLLNLIADLKSMETEKEEITDKIADAEIEIDNMNADLKSLKSALEGKRIELEDLIGDMTAAETSEEAAYVF